MAGSDLAPHLRVNLGAMAYPAGERTVPGTTTVTRVVWCNEFVRQSAGVPIRRSHGWRGPNGG